MTKVAEDGTILQPTEKLEMEADKEPVSSIVDKTSVRQATLIEMKSVPGRRTKISFPYLYRGLIGYRLIFTQNTRGFGVMNQVFADRAPEGPTKQFSTTRNEVIVSTAAALIATHALASLEARETLFVGPR